MAAVTDMAMTADLKHIESFLAVARVGHLQGLDAWPSVDEDRGRTGSANAIAGDELDYQFLHSITRSGGGWNVEGTRQEWGRAGRAGHAGWPTGVHAEQFDKRHAVIGIIIAIIASLGQRRSRHRRGHQRGDQITAH